MSSTNERHRMPYEVTLTDFKDQVTLLPVDGGDVVAFQGQPADHWRKGFEQTFRDFFENAGLPQDEIDTKVTEGIENALEAFSEHLSVAQPVLPALLPEINRWIVAFDARMFEEHRENDRGVVMVAGGLQGMITHLNMKMADGDPVRYLHNMLVEQATKEGLVTPDTDPRRNDPLYRKHAGLPPVADNPSAD